MEKQQYDIECGRCGEISWGVLTEEEVRVTSDGIGPAYRYCEQCGKVTGWIKAKPQRAEREETGSDASAQSAEKLVPCGEERIATSSERDEVNARLHRPDGL